MHSYEKCAYVADIIAKLILDKDAVFNYTWHQGLLRYKSRVWVGCDQDLQQKLITSCHSSAVGGHSGIPVTLRRLKQIFA
jgi:hypothetical protein